jgi:hypothetical protein
VWPTNRRTSRVRTVPRPQSSTVTRHQHDPDQHDTPINMTSVETT